MSPKRSRTREGAISRVLETNAAARDATKLYQVSSAIASAKLARNRALARPQDLHEGNAKGPAVREHGLAKFGHQQAWNGIATIKGGHGETSHGRP